MTRILILLTLTIGLGSVHAQDGPADIFIVAGQSNAEGRGEGNTGPWIDDGVAWAWSPDTQSATPLARNQRGHLAGSAWPAFAGRYHEITGRKVVIVEMAVGGTSQVVSSGGDGHWDVHAGSTLFDDAVGAHKQARDAYGIESPIVAWLWSQGEQDAVAIDRGLTTADQYRDGLRSMVDSLDAVLPGTRFLVLRTGRPTAADTPGYQAVRHVQRQLVVEHPNVEAAFDDAVSFPVRGLMRDGVHWNQRGLDEAGRSAAEVAAGFALASTRPPETAAPQLWPNPVRAGEPLYGTRGEPMLIDLLGRTLALTPVRGSLNVPSVPPGVYLVRDALGVRPVTVLP